MRSFTVGFTSGLACVLWANPTFAALYALVVSIGLLVSIKLNRHWRLLIIGLFLGGLSAQLNLYNQQKRQFTSTETETDYLLIGTVIGAPKEDSRRISFDFRIDRFVGHKPKSRPRQIRLSWYGSAHHTVRAGDQWQLEARLKPPSSLGNPGGFNYVRWLFQRRIHATGYVRDASSAQRLNSRPYHLSAMRQSIAEQTQTLPAANEFSTLVQGLTVGLTNDVSQEQWQTLRRSGTAHLLAISGLHIGLISGWFYLIGAGIWQLLSRASGGLSHRLITKPIFCMVLSCLGACVYAALAGFSLPTQRALTMLGVFSVASGMRRVWPPGTALLLALFLVLLIDPLSVLSVGFWLSFGTVSALFYLYNGRLHRLGKLNSVLGAHLKLGIVLLPVSAWFFQQGAFVAPLANVIAVPVVGFLVIPLSFFVAVFASIWPGFANLLLIVVQWVLAYLFDFLDWLLMLPASSVPLFLPSPLLFFCVLVGCILLFAPRGLRIRWLSVPLIAPCVVLNLLGKPVKELELHVLDVGQGLAAVIFTSNHTVLFDTGKSLSANVSMVDRVIQPFLVSKGRSTVEVSIVSHGDDDHAGGLDTLMDLYPDTFLYSGDNAHGPEHGAHACLAGHSFVLDNVTFSFLHPGLDDQGSDNNLSCVVLVHYGETRLLLTGDIEAESEQLLVERIGDVFPVTVMVAPHHGSRSSSTPAFVSLLPPENVIYAAGERNAFDFPHPDVVARYDRAGAKAFTTGEAGAVSMRFNRSGLSAPVDQYWNNRRRYKY